MKRWISRFASNDFVRFTSRMTNVRTVFWVVKESETAGYDYRPLLGGYADDAVLHFNDGPHRWAGDHRGKPAIERFLRDFTGAGITGEIGALWIGGPPWALTLVVRFDDRATAGGGEELYANRTVIVARTRWGKIVEQDDFYLDTARIVAFEEKLRALGVVPATAR